MARAVIDLHCDSVFSLEAGKDLRAQAPGCHVDLPRMRKGGVALQVFAAYIAPETPPDEAFARTAGKLDAIDAFARSGEGLAPAENAADIRACMASGKTGVMLAVENGLAIENSLEKLEALRRRKVRILTLVHSRHNSWVASCADPAPFRPDGGESGDFGLSRFGERAVDAMADLGIIPDLSHASERAFWDALRRMKKPAIASHSCAYRLCAAARNLKDDQLKALGDSGGVAGVNFFSAFLSEEYRRIYEKNPASPDLARVKVPSSIIADHIDWMIGIAGEDCVALGSDFDGIPAAPEGVSGSDYYPLLDAELCGRGYSEARIEKIFSGNFLRVLEAWA